MGTSLRAKRTLAGGPVPTARAAYFPLRAIFHFLRVPPSKRTVWHVMALCFGPLQGFLPNLTSSLSLLIQKYFCCCFLMSIKA